MGTPWNYWIRDITMLCVLITEMLTFATFSPTNVYTCDMEVIYICSIILLFFLPKATETLWNLEAYEAAVTFWLLKLIMM